MDTRTKEAIRYLGYGKCAVDEKTLAMIQESFQELEEIARVKLIYRIFELSFDTKNGYGNCRYHFINVICDCI